MATYNLSALQNGSTLAFDPATDQLVFDLPGVSAADLVMSSLNTGSVVLFQLPTLSFSLVGTNLSDLGSADLKFADGSRFLQANSGNGWATSLTTGSGNDLLVGSRAAGPSLTASSSADGVNSFNGTSNASALSGDGRYAVFQSSASGLLPGPAPSGGAVYLKDLDTGELLFAGNAEGGFGSPAVSAVGAKVAFASNSLSLSAADNNGVSDIYMRDMVTGATTLVSASATGVVGNSGSIAVALSNDGRFAVFQSAATNLVTGDNGTAVDVFRKDLLTGDITLVTKVAGSAIGLGGSFASISGNGSVVAFRSFATTLVNGDTNNAQDIFVNQNGFERVSISTAGAQANGPSDGAAISADGRFVVFHSFASNLVGGDSNATDDVFLRNLGSDTTTLVSASAQGVAGNGSSRFASVSGDGRYVAFSSSASNLVAGDTNGEVDVFVKDTLTGAIARVGAQFDASVNPSISADGSRISFDTLINGGFSGSAQQVLVFANPLLSRTLAGGIGNDVYVIDNAADVVVEAASAGTDTVRSSISLLLADNVEQLVLLGSGNLNGTGNAGANLITGTLGNNRLDGGSGNDTASYANARDGVTVDLTLTDPQDTGGAGVDTLVSIESATGSAHDDALFGTDTANVLNGGAGADLLIGGAGNDTYWIDQAGDLMIEETGGGTDTVCSTITWTLGSEFENLHLKGSASVNATGNAANNVLAGNSGTNVLNGGDGIDTASYSGAKTGVNVALDRSGYQNLGSSGADMLVGIENLTGSGFNDTLHGSVGDNVFNGGNGVDTVSYARAAGAVFVSLALTGPQDTRGPGQDPVARGGGGVGLDSSTGGEGVDTLLNVENLLGGVGNDSLSGNGSANRLDGGLGADTLTGAAGNDTFVVDNRFDVLVEALDEGLDTVITTVSLTLGQNLENLTLAEGFAIDGTGNELANRLTGNSADNELTGGGGRDTLVGGAGNDFYFVDASNDVVTESAGGGIDRVVANVNFTLGAEVEDLDLNFPATVGTGNALNNRITGDSNSQTLQGLDGDDRLDAQGGADTLIGGNGNDTYIIVNTGVVVQEAAGGGTLDTVDSSVSHTLAAEVERLMLSGSDAINGTGNGAANTLTGNSAANVLDGGAGADTMAGGGGNDLYRIDSGGDVVTEGVGGGDDTQTGAVSFSLAAEVETGVLTGTGNISLTGNNLANRLTGNDGANILSTGGGADTLSGGAGNDTYNIDNAAAQVFELAGGGTDTVQSTVSVTLAADVERLTLAGTSAINGTGNALGNLIQGNVAANVINGSSGIDTFTYANFSAAVTANLGTGVASGAGGADSFTSIENLTGGSGNDSLTGNTGANLLDGGLGNDTMVGGGGNDTYVVGSAGDVVTEIANAGTDTILSAITLTLVDGVEKLTLTGSGALNGTGNGAGNTLTGNGAANLLDGAGGADLLIGGAGADTFRLASLSGSDTLSDFVSGTDKILIGQGAIAVGDGDNVVEGAVATAGTGGFKPTAELVDVGTQVVGSITTTSAAAAIGSATSAYVFGSSALFAVDNGALTAVYRFVAADADAAVESFELTLLANLTLTANVVIGDFMFGA